MSTRILVDDSRLKEMVRVLKDILPQEIDDRIIEIQQQTIAQAKSRLPDNFPADATATYSYGREAGVPYVKWDRTHPWIGWWQHGGTRGRTYVKPGRTFYPIVGAYTRKEVIKAAEAARDEIIRRYNLG